MTQEEKAKAYDEVRKKIAIRFGSNVADEIFSQFEMSEDERIRKWLINLVKGHIEWLEDRIREQLSNGQVYGGELNEAKNAIAWLEKQGKQKSIDNLTQQEAMDIAVAKCFEQGEQKPVDKVEPKFRDGDWLLCKNLVDKPFCITEVKESYYLTSCGSFIMFGQEDDYRNWTIQDAKDGDVLCSEQIILLFKQWEDNTDWDFVIAHAGIDISGKLQITDGHWLISNESKPATKEQRDLLFAKMKEAGYEWDAEKKELKKIEQSPAWSEEDDNCLSTIIAEFSKCAGKSVSKDEWMRCNDWLNSLRDRVQPKQEWSEEDETILDNLIWALKEDMVLANDRDEYVNWLKSLKERYTWRPSDEQMDALRQVISGCSYNIEPLVEIEEHLKKLREK